MKLIAVTAGLFAVALAILLFCLSGKIDKEAIRLQRRQFNVLQLLAGHNAAGMLRDAGIAVAPKVWRSNYIAFFSLINNRNPNSEEEAAINKLTEKEYLERVNPRIREIGQRLAQPADKKDRLQRISLLCFVLLVTSQLIAMWASLRL